MTNALYTTREQWLNAFAKLAKPHFERVGAPLPDKLRIGVGFTSTGARGKRIGECWSQAASADGHFEIFLAPTTQTDSRIADILTHELIHAAVGLDAGHGPKFKKVALALGLGGKMTNTVAEQGWYEWALPILDALGAMPYAALSSGKSSAKPKQRTNLLKVECSSCGWLARVTNKHIEPYSALRCPDPDCSGSLMVEG